MNKLKKYAIMLTSSYKDMCDAVREKLKDNTKAKSADMPERILSIPTEINGELPKLDYSVSFKTQEQNKDLLYEYKTVKAGNSVDEPFDPPGNIFGWEINGDSSFLFPYTPSYDVDMWAIKDPYPFQIKKIKDPQKDPQIIITKYIGDNQIIEIPHILCNGIPIKIGSGAFQALPIQEVTVPPTVKLIESNAFSRCSSLKKINLEDVEEIRDHSFQYNSALKNINGESLLSIGFSSFAYCTNLQEIKINNVENIDAYAFMNCPKLKWDSLQLSSSIKNIGPRGFSNSFSDLEKPFYIYFPQGEYLIDSYAFYYCNNIKNVVFPESQGKIEIGAFCFGDLNGNYILLEDELILPDSIYNIGSSAFYHDVDFGGIHKDKFYGWRKIKIGKNVDFIPADTQDQEIPRYTFVPYAGYLKDIELDSANNHLTLIEYNEGKFLLRNKDGCLIAATSIDLPENCGIKKIDSELFSQRIYNHIDIAEARIPEGVEVIGQRSYDGLDCRGQYYSIRYMSVYLPSSITKLGSNCFDAVTPDSSLHSHLNIYYAGTPEQWKTIKGNTPQNYAPKIWGYDIYYNYGQGSTGNCEYIKYSTSSNPDLYIVSIKGPGEMQDYPSSGSAPWGNTVQQVNFSNGVTKIGNHSFQNCKDLTELTIPNDVKIIGESAFNGCTNITSLVIPDSVANLGYLAFSSCSSLKNITIGAGLLQISPYSFLNCSAVENISISKDNKQYYDYENTIIDKNNKIVIFGCKNSILPQDIKSIGNYAFYWCTDLKNIVLPNSLITIGGYSFSGCNSIEYINIPNGVTSIGANAFSNCTSLQKVDIGSGLAVLSEQVFSRCGSLSEINLKSGISRIDKQAFSFCSNLKRINIPDTVEYIGEGAFILTGLEEIQIPSNITEIPKQAFWACSHLNKITLPISIKKIGENAFADCSSITDVYYEGTQEQWNSITLLSGNEALKQATIHYNS